ncbi:MAG: sulfotransferase family 2 domain-containing protein [Hyphomonadaceae bacterium]|nr:sulfotransferase family 2 domain-containing protein [Hyphomonadaceae bacterium]
MELATDHDWTQLSELFAFPPSQAEYLINYSPRFSYVFIETPKAGCSTIKRKLQAVEVDGDRSKLPANVHDKANSPLQSPRDSGLSDQQLLRDADLFRFCFTRNPYTRVLSAYLDKIVDNDWERARLAPTLDLPADEIVSFESFLIAVANQPDPERDIHWRTQVGLLKPRHIPYDFIGRFENIGSSLRSVVARISEKASGEMEPLAFHATNATRRVIQYVGKAEAKLIRSIYADDFAVFCYARDPYFAAF